MLRIAIIDFEATALSKMASAIEVGVAIFSHQENLVQTWSSLIRLGPDCSWSAQSAEVHRISRADLKNAPDARFVAAKLNRIMTGVPAAYCDGFEFDTNWMRSLYLAAELEPTFSIEPIEDMPRMHMRVVRHHMAAYLNQASCVHRAGADALRLMQAYVYALGKDIRIQALS